MLRGENGLEGGGEENGWEGGAEMDGKRGRRRKWLGRGGGE